MHRKRQVLAIFLTLIMPFVNASIATDYVKRFTTYMTWNQTLPLAPEPSFFAFIQEDSPLATKLREKWLYHLAHLKDWSNYKKYYHASADINLQCLNLEAEYYLGNLKSTFEDAKILWLSATTTPPVCNPLFKLMFEQKDFNDSIIGERIRLSLEKRNIALARFLFKQYKTPQSKEEQLLLRLYQNPRLVNQIQRGDLAGDFYLYALKRLVSTNMPLAIAQAASAKAKKLLSAEQRQNFIAHVALYKAIRNQKDSFDWFQKVKPQYYSDLLLDWEIRAALQSNDWNLVEALINKSKNKDSPCWQYWLARAKEALGEMTEAKAGYEALAKTRNYYGFLSSLRLNIPFSFNEEQSTVTLKRLQPYQAILETIKSLYRAKQMVPASRLLNDFMSELPVEDKASLVYWLENNLHWTAKALFLSKDETLLDQLFLRFPLVNKNFIATHAKNYDISMALIYSIIRQESEFRENVESEAGARGLMQVMPETAAMVAKREKIAYSNKEQLFSSEKNIHLGVAYLKYLAKRFNNHALLMTAAYNAGPKQVNFWLLNHPPKQIDIWIETLPWHETRNYLKNVIAFYAVYQYRLKLKPNLENFMKPF